jgi:hypothetical protein
MNISLSIKISTLATVNELIKVISLFILSTFILLFISCSSHETENMLNSELGKMTYEESLQRFGAPDKCGEEGQTKTCNWVYGSSKLWCNKGTCFTIDAPTANLTFVNDVLSYWTLSGKWK